MSDSAIRAEEEGAAGERGGDGEQWVTDSGVLDQGVRQVTNLDGARMTPDHKINTGLSWREARELVSSERIRCQAYSHGLAHSPSSGLTSGTQAALKRWLSHATVGRPPTESTSQTFSRGDQNSAMRALGSRPRLPGKTTGSTPTSFRTRNTDVAYSIGLPRQSGGAIAQPTKRGQTTAVGASWSATSGVSRLKAGAGSYATSSRFQGGTTPPSTLTASTRMGTTRRVISVSSRGKRTRGTSGKFKNSRGKSTSYERVYDLVNAGPRRRFTILTDVGPLIVSNCELALGYQGWVGAWRAFDPNGVQTDDELKQIILAWRKASPAVVEFWGGQSRRRGYETVEEYVGVEGAFIQAILNPGKVFDCRGLKFQMEGGAVYLTLLSGRRIAYHNAQLHQSDKPGSRYAISYWGWNTNPKNGPRGWIQIRTWGGRLCIAEGTPVLTLDGWKPIEDITALDSVWDGVEWVSCDGAICNGEKETIEAYGAWMTPDHQVLTTEGWRDGEEKGLQRADARIPDGYWPEGDQRQAGALGIQVRLRGGEDNRGPRHSEDDNPQRQGILRVHEAEDYFREADRPRDEPPSGVCCVGVDEGPMPPPNARSVAAIRRARDNGLPALAGELREFLGGHGADISARVGDRPQGQQRRVLPGELPMGGFTDAEREPPRQRSVGWADGGGDCPADGPTKVDGVLPHEGGGDAGANAGETKRRQKVYDVMNCGPRNRFTIWAGGDGLIVHNCENIVQATSNDLLRFASVNLERAGYPIVLHVYDEIVAEVPQGRGSIEELEAWMRYTPDWATCADGQKWPVGAAGGWRADRYRKG